MGEGLTAARRAIVWSPAGPYEEEKTAGEVVEGASGRHGTGGAVLSGFGGSVGMRCRCR